MTHVVKAKLIVKDGEPRVVFDIIQYRIDPDGGQSVPPFVLGTYKTEGSAEHACAMLNKHTGKLK